MVKDGALLIHKELLCEGSHGHCMMMPEQAMRSHQSGLPPPVPQESITTWSCSPARSTTLLNTASAVGLLHMLPVQSASYVTQHSAWRDILLRLWG